MPGICVMRTTAAASAACHAREIPTPTHGDTADAFAPPAMASEISAHSSSSLAASASSVPTLDFA